MTYYYIMRSFNDLFYNKFTFTILINYYFKYVVKEKHYLKDTLFNFKYIM